MGVLVKYLCWFVHGSSGQVSVWAGWSWEFWSSICIGWLVMGVLVKYLYRLVCSWEFWSSICIGWLVMGVLVKYLYRLVGHGSPGQVSV